MFGRKKNTSTQRISARRDIKPEYREPNARRDEEQSKRLMAEYERTRNPKTLAAARMCALGAEGWRRGCAIEDLPEELKRKHHFDEALKVLGRARNGGAR